MTTTYDTTLDNKDMTIIKPTARDFADAMQLQRDMMHKRDATNRQNKLLFPVPEL